MTRRKEAKYHVGGRGIVLDITAEIINAAVPKDSSHCVLADALKAAVPNATRVSVDLATIRFTDPESQRRYVYLTPAPGQAILVNFDQGVMPTPGVMRLGNPAQVLASGSKGKRTTRKRAKGEDEKTAKRLADPTPTVTSRSGQTVVYGGRTPPTAALSSTRGRRRSFGLKTLRP